MKEPPTTLVRPAARWRAAAASFPDVVRALSRKKIAISEL